MAFSQLLGAKLVDKDGNEFNTDEKLGNCKAVGIYFSAHWCPPCRGFTPKLASSYTDHFKAKGMEIVFASSDRDESSFKGYLNEMPWLALPFAERDLKEKLSSKYKVQGIPTFVIIDSDGSLITNDGRSAVANDPTGENFPWKPKTVAEVMSDIKALQKGKEEVGVDALKGKTVGLYFSAHWCPPCRGFTPKLVETYNTMKANGNDKFEVVFVSSDRDQGSFDEYYGEMPWLALPFKDRVLKNVLSDTFEVQGIPTLVIINGDDFSIINADGRAALASDPKGENFPWTPPPYEALENASFINDSPTFIILADKCSEEDAAKAEEAMKPIATEIHEKNEDDRVRFCIGKKGDDLADKIRSFCSQEGDAASIVLIDLQAGQKYYDGPTDITTSSIKTFLEGYKNKTLEGKPLKF